MSDPALLIYGGALVVAMLLSLALAVLAYLRLQVPGALAFLLGNLASFCYSLGSLLEITSATPGQALAALTLEYVGISTIGPFLFLTSISSTRGAWVVPRGLSVLLFVVPVITIFSVATNSYHHLFYTSLELARNGPFTIPVLDRGPLFMVNFVYMNFCLFLGIVIPLRAALRAPKAQRDPLLLLVVASLLPWLGMGVYQLGWSPYGLDVAPFGLALSGLVFTVALSRYRLFDLTPLVVEQVFANMKEAVLVVDQKDRLVGVNPALTLIFPQVSEAAVGRDLSTLGVPDLRGGSDVSVGPSGAMLVYQVDRSPLRDKHGSVQGEIFILADITQRVDLAVRLSRLARHDELTGLPNRRSFLETLAAETDRLRRYGGSLTLAVADLDHFKKVNDTWGHEAGDAALVHTATVWGAALRNSDLVARYGGEEFTILMTETPAEVAWILLERLRSVLENAPLVWNGKTIRLTASFGFAEYPGAKTEDLDAWIRRADEALYRAKEHGRNRVDA